MSISCNCTSAVRPQSGGVMGLGQERRDARERLASALESGNLDAARQAYTDLKRLGGGHQFRRFQDQGGTATTLRNDFSAIGSALDAGDVELARTAFQKMSDDFQAARAARHPQEPGNGPIPVDQPVDGSAAGGGFTINTTVTIIRLSFSYSSSSAGPAGSQLDVTG